MYRKPIFNISEIDRKDAILYRMHIVSEILLFNTEEQKPYLYSIHLHFRLKYVVWPYPRTIQKRTFAYISFFSVSEKYNFMNIVNKYASIAFLIYLLRTKIDFQSTFKQSTVSHGNFQWHPTKTLDVFLKKVLSVRTI